MVIINVCKGIKRIIEFQLRCEDDKIKLAEIQNNLLCRLTTATEEVGKNMLKSIKEIDKLLN